MRCLMLFSIINILSLYGMDISNNPIIVTPSDQKDQFFKTVFDQHFSTLFMDIKENSEQEKQEALKATIIKKDFYKNLNTLKECHEFIDFIYRNQNKSLISHQFIALVIRPILPIAEDILSQQEKFRDEFFNRRYESINVHNININYSFYDQSDLDNFSNFYLLDIAARGGDQAGFKWLLSKGADPNRCILSLFLFGQYPIIQELIKYRRILKEDREIFPHLIKTMDLTTISHVDKTRLLLLLKIDPSLDEKNIMNQFNAMKELRIKHEAIMHHMKKDTITNDEKIMYLLKPQCNGS